VTFFVGWCGMVGYKTGENDKTRGDGGRGQSLFSICLTWLQYAANDHDTHQLSALT
jgi:hypothetical protein